jgi:hypothetical protein
MAEKDAYALACIGLYSRLWDALERLCTAGVPRAACSQIIRLEIHLVLQCCETWRWRRLLTAAQRLAVQETLRDLLHRLGEGGPAISAAVAGAAQNRLLDAILEHCALLGHAATRSPLIRILLSSAGTSGSMMRACDEAGSDADSGYGPWAGRQASRGRQDLR